MNRRIIASALVTAGLTALMAQTSQTLQAPATRADAEALQHKIERMLDREPGRAPAARRTIVTEHEINSYLYYYALDGQLPTGVTDPSVGIAGGGRVTAHAVVDLDAVREDRAPGGVFDPMSYLGGRMPMTATGIVSVQDGVGRFAFESASAGTIPLPKLLLQYVLSYYSRTPDDPDGLSLDDAIEMPAGIQSIDVEQGRAIIVQ
jgi:hypothetical protein